MKLALHRSLTFWSGILLMAFICLAWADSLKQISSWNSNGSMDPPYWIRSRNSAIAFGLTISRPSADPLRSLASDNWY